MDGRVNRPAFLASMLCGLLVSWSFSCGGGGSADPAAAVTVAQAVPQLQLAFSEDWEPRTQANGVFGVVATQLLQQTADSADPQQAWAANNITGKWGTLRTLDGSVSGLPDVTGLGPNASWATDASRLSFHAAPMTAPSGQSTGGFALISKASFPRGQRIVIESDIDLRAGTLGAFAGLALIAGEGDYRELALFRRATGDTIDLVAPLHADTLIPRPAGRVTLRIEYDPISGFDYFVNGTLVAHEAIDHLGASFAADPHVGLYFTGDSNVPNAFAEGSVGPVRVWTSQEPANG